MTRAVIIPFKATSEGAKVLSKYAGIPLMTPQQYWDGRARDVDVVVNWGAGYLGDSSWRSDWLNRPSAIETAVDKRLSFKRFKAHSVPHPRFTLSQEQAQEWASRSIIVVRGKTGGMMGDGIQVVQPHGQVPYAPLYTVHVGHDEEFRVHVFKGMVINAGRKFRYDNTADPLIRNWGAWRFENLDPDNLPSPVKDAALRAVHALGLDFGAADIGWHDDRGAHVFEVNTAPGTGHNTITRYAEAIRWYCHI